MFVQKELYRYVIFFMPKFSSLHVYIHLHTFITILEVYDNIIINFRIKYYKSNENEFFCKHNYYCISLMFTVILQNSLSKGPNFYKLCSHAFWEKPCHSWLQYFTLLYFAHFLMIKIHSGISLSKTCPLIN